MENIQSLLDLWRLRSIRASIQHYRATHWFRMLDSLITTVNVISTISILFAEASNNVTHYVSIAALVTVITSTLQYILDYKVRWKAHERAGKGYAILNREIEQLLACGNIDEKEITSTRARFEHLTDSSPAVPALFWNAPNDITKQIVQRENRRGEDPSISTPQIIPTLEPNVSVPNGGV